MQPLGKFTQTPGTILCCECGTSITPNPANKCVTCIRSKVDITDGIPKQSAVQWCKGCGRYLHPPNLWVNCEPESRELLTLCLKRIPKLQRTVKLVDAGFVWTEPHSKRLKVKLTIQKQVFSSTILQQTFIIEYIVQNQQCPNCQTSYTPHTWKAVVQSRQKVDHKRTFFYLEQLILKHNLHLQMLHIKEQPDGLDFYFTHKSHASRFVEFMSAVAPIKYKQSEKLISHDDKSNNYKFNYAFSVEMAPICKNDLVCLPRPVSNALGGISPLLLVHKTTSMLHFIDPNTLQIADVTGSMYWQAPYPALATSRTLIPFIVLDVAALGPTRGKFILADVQCARVKDFGVNDTMFLTRTHLGHLLKPGDTVLGYDCLGANFNSTELNQVQRRSKFHLQDVILVKKTYPNRRKKNRPRYWKVKTLDKEAQDNLRKNDVLRAQRDFEEFHRDLEEDPEYRKAINLYPVEGASQIRQKLRVEAAIDGEDDLPEPELSELTQGIQSMNLGDSKPDVEMKD